MLDTVKEQHVSLGTNHLQLLNAAHLRVLSLLIFEESLLVFWPRFLPRPEDGFVERSSVLFLVFQLRVFGPGVVGLVEERGRNDVAIECVVEFEVKEGDQKQRVLFVFESLEIAAEVGLQTARKGYHIEKLTQRFPVLGAVLTAELYVSRRVLPLRKNGVERLRIEASSLRKERLHFLHELLMEGGHKFLVEGLE